MRSYRALARLVNSSWTPARNNRRRTVLKSPFSSQVEITTHQKSLEATFTSSYDTQQATALVDSLLKHTASLLQHASHHVIAFSGGVDSSLTAALVHRLVEARAVLGISAAVPAEQRELAVRVAAQIGIPLQCVPTDEGTDPMYLENAGQACLACKTHLYSTLQAIYASVDDESVQLYNGTNAEDVQDPTRVGLIAAQRFRVQSPLLHINKNEVRLAARHLGLLNWNYAASPCLRSRLAFGVPATRDHLERIEKAERFVRQQLAEPTVLLDETSNVRVRLLAQNRVCIEVDEGELLEYAQEHVKRWKPYLQVELQFAAVQVRAFRSGSVALQK